MQTTSAGVSRRELMLAGAGAAAVALDMSSALAQGSAGPAPAAAPPGRVAVERLDGGVLLIGIDRPEASNLLDAAILTGLGKAYYQLDHDDGLRVGVLYGKGSHFSLGLDGPAFVAAVNAGQFPPKDPDWITPFNVRPPFREKPLVAAVQGGTKLGGHELCLAADIRVAASDAAFGQAEVMRGVFPAGGATVRLVREAGWGNAMRLMLTGEEWGAEEARRLGLVQEVTPPGKQLERAIELARKIAAAAPLGIRATLASAHQALVGEEPALAALTPVFLRLLQSEDRKEFYRAESERRPPVFRGL